MRLSRTLSLLSLIAILSGTISTSALAAAPTTPPPGGYTGGLFSQYFQNIVEGAPNTGSCAPGESIIGFTTTSDGTYGTPICAAV